MEKATAELDGTLVFNYLDDDLELIDTEEEPKLDTSFDENQNPKFDSKAAISTETPKKNKDLIVVLENEVLTPIKHADYANTGNANEFAVNVDAPEQNTTLQHPKPQTPDNNGLGTKRSRVDDEKTGLETPELKKAKTVPIGVIEVIDYVASGHFETPKSAPTPFKNLKVQTSAIFIKSKNIGTSTPKRGRPKGSGIKKLNSSVISKLQVSKLKKINQIASKEKKQNAVSDLITSKPKRGRPKGFKIKKPDTLLTEIQAQTKNIEKRSSELIQQSIGDKLQSSTPMKIEQGSYEAKQQAAVTETNDLEPSKRKRGRPKGFKVKKLVSSVIKVEPQLKNFEKISSLAKQQDIVNDPCHFKLTETIQRDLEAKQQDVVAESNDLESSKSKRSRSKSSKVKKLVSSTPTAEVLSKVDAEESSEVKQQNSIDLESSKPKRGRPKGYKVKKLVGSILLTESQSKGFAKESSEAKKHEIFKELQPGKLTESEQKGIEAKQQVSIEESINLEPSKPKRGRSKVKKLDTTQTTESKNINEESLEEKEQVDSIKLSETVQRNIEANQHYPVSDINSLEESKPKRGRPKGFKVKKLDTSLTAIDTQLEDIDKRSLKINKQDSVDKSQLVKPKKIEPKDFEAKSEDPIEETNDLELSKPKRGRPQGFKPKKLVSTLITVEPQSMDTKKLSTEGKQQNTVRKFAGKDIEQQEAIAETNNLESCKPKRGRSKGFKVKKIGTSMTSIDSESKGTEEGASETKQQGTNQETNDANMGKPKDMGTKKLNTSIATIESQPSISNNPNVKDLVFNQLDIAMEAKNRDPSQCRGDASKSLIASTVEEFMAKIELQSSRPREGEDKGLEAKKLNTEKRIPKVLITKKANTLVATESWSTKDVYDKGKDFETRQQDNIMTPKDVESNAPKRGRPKASVAKKITTCADPQLITPHKNTETAVDIIQKNSAVVETRDLNSSKTKSPKEKELEIKQKDDAVETKELEIAKRKKGRPKLLPPNKIGFLIASTSSELFPCKKNTETEIQQNTSAMKTIQLQPLKPKSPGEKVLETEHKDDTVTKDLEVFKPKRGRPKAVIADKMNVSMTSNEKQPLTFKKNAESKMQKNTVAVDAIQLESPKPKENGLAAKQEDDEIKTKDLEFIKPKRGKAKALISKEINVSITMTDSHTFAAEETKQSAATVEAINSEAPKKPKGGRPKSLLSKEINCSVTMTDSHTFGAEGTKRSAPTVEAIDLEAPKPKRGRPKSLSAKNLNVPIVSEQVEIPQAKINAFSGVELQKTDLGPYKFKVVRATCLKNKTRNDSIPAAESQPKPKKSTPKSLGTKKINPFVLINIMKNSEVNESEICSTATTQLDSSEKNKDSESSKCKTVKLVGVSEKKVNSLGKFDHLEASKSGEPKATPKRGRPKGVVTKKKDVVIKYKTQPLKSKKKIQTVEADKIVKSFKGLGITKASEPSKPKESDIGSVELTQTDASLGTTKSLYNKPKGPKKGSFESERQGVGIEIIDLVTVEPKKAASKVDTSGTKSKGLEFNFKVEKSKSTGESSKHLNALDAHSFTHKETEKNRLESKNQSADLEIIDLEHFDSMKTKGLRAEEVSVSLTNKNLESSKSEITEVINEDPTQVRNKNSEPSQFEEDVNETRKISASEGTKDFEFLKPKQIRSTGLAVRKVTAFLQTRDTKIAKPESVEAGGVEHKQVDASVNTNGIKPLRLQQASVQPVRRKVSMCTVGTQTLDGPEDDITVKEVKENGPGQKESVGTQISESPKSKEADVKGLGRKTSVSSVEVIDLDMPLAKTAENTHLGKKKLFVSMGIKQSQSNLLRRTKVSESGGATQNNDEPIKIEDDRNTDVIPARLTNNNLRECQEIDVKYETVEQIHTEFKYESQSETEEMKKRRRMMRGRRHGFNKMLDTKGQTTLDSYFRIVDLDGKIQMKYKNQIFKCDHCLYVGNSKANLDRHSLIHRNPDEIIWFHCTECPYKSKYEHQLKSHFLIHRNPNEIQFFQCPHCEVKCSRKHNLTNHIRSIHADRTYSFKCAECDYTTFSKDRLVAHMKKHSKEVHACTLCKFVTKRKEYLESHFKMKHMQEVERPFPCDTCSYKGKTKRELDRHFDRMHNKDQLHVYQCNHCAFNSIYKKNLEFHLLHMHQNSEGFQKFICGHCNKTFSYKNGLKVHIIRCHIKLTDDDWHKCLECKYRSKDVATLKRHIKRNHGAPRLHCKQCSFATNRQMSMDAHLKTHEFDNEDILKCPECPYRILQMTSFLYHMKVIHGKPISSKEAEQYYMQED